MKTILLADDDANVREMVRTALAGPDREILEAHDGPSALTRAREKRPDVVLLDWMMPGLSGIAVASILRRERDTASVPIIMLTAKTTAGDVQQAKQVDVTDYVVKPFSPADLVRRVEAALVQAGELKVKTA